MPAVANPMAQAMFSTTPFSYLPLLTDGDDVVSRSGTVASGIGVLLRGTIVKIDPATGAITLPAAAADCNAILVNDIDATTATVAATVYLSGKFSAAAVVWPAALGHGAVADALRNFSILIESVVYTDGTLVKSAPMDAEAAQAKAQLDANRAALKAAEDTAAAAATEPPPPPAVPPSDSLLGYLTAEERALHPELADVPPPEPAAPTTPPPTTP